MTAQRRISADTALRDCPEGNVGLAFPLPISDRLDALVALAEAAGDRTNRKELLASLILATSPIGQELAAALRNYRRATARDARIDGKSSSTILLPSRRPGPRPRKRR
jgi:hypothetical protein